MTRDQQLQVIREACVAANSELAFCAKELCKHDTEDSGRCKISYHLRPIGLVDVLMATELSPDQPRNILVNIGGVYELNLRGNIELKAFWDCRNDDLTAQSDETLDFLYNLLK